MDGVSSPMPVWQQPAGESGAVAPALAGLPPELLLLATMMRSQNAQTSHAKLSVNDAFERLEALRDQIEEAMERAREAQESGGWFGDVADLFGGDIATIAGVIASAALVVGSGGAGAAVLVATLAIGLTAGAKVGEELGLDPKIVLALQLAGAALGLAGGDVCQAGQLWGTVHTGAKVAQGSAVAIAGGATIVAGQHRGDAADLRAEAAFGRVNEQLQQQLADDQIAELEKLAQRWRFLTQAASSVTEQSNDVSSSVVMRIGG